MYEMISLNKSSVSCRNYSTDRCKNIVLWTTFGQVFRSSCDHSDRKFYKRCKTAAHFHTLV